MAVKFTETKNAKSEISRRRGFAALLLLCLLICYALLWLFTGISPLEVNNYNSFSVQAESWLSGRLDVDYMPWLEQAVFRGKYYISFPPLPSVVLLPLVLFFGANTPDNILCVIIAIAGALFAYKSALCLGKSPKGAFSWAFFVTGASNFLFISMSGWVWFMAQNLSFMFTMMSLYFALSKGAAGKRRGGLSLFFLSCAVGCRPIQVVFFPVLFFLLYENNGFGTFIKDFAVKWRWLLPSACVAIFLCALNYARFGSIFEFGHNYLPEFLESPKGQFSASYIPYNLFRSIRIFQYDYARISFPTFDGFAFYLVMPIWLSCVFYSFRRKTSRAFDWLVIACIGINLLITCAHKTMGGWHFGCRYFIDATPFAYLLALKNSQSPRPGKLDRILITLGVLINIIGTIAFYNDLF
ncbi:MAG: hypothetical protein ACOX8S_05175 [Christensenellales bacterium]|jgi:hypothetical protein